MRNSNVRNTMWGILHVDNAVWEIFYVTMCSVSIFYVRLFYLSNMLYEIFYVRDAMGEILCEIWSMWVNSIWDILCEYMLSWEILCKKYYVRYPIHEICYMRNSMWDMLSE